MDEFVKKAIEQISVDDGPKYTKPFSVKLDEDLHEALEEKRRQGKNVAEFVRSMITLGLELERQQKSIA